MKKANLVITTIVGIIMILTISANAQDWPQWRGVSRDGNVAGFKPPKAWPKELKQTWKITVGLGDATPVLVGNRLYCFTRQGGDEVLLCLDAATGKELWQNKYAAVAITGPSANLHPGPRSTPTVADGKVITFGVGGVLSCVDASNGKVLWRKENTSNLNPQFYTGMSPIVVDKICVAFVGGKDNGTILALDLASGNEKWKWTGEGPTYSSPVIMTVDGKKQLVAFTEKSLVGINLADGKQLWKVETLPQSRHYNAATPVIDGQTVILTGSGTGTKAVRVEKQGDGYVTKELWNNPDLGTTFNTPVIKDGYLYGLSNARKLYCMDVAKGQTAWSDTALYSNFGAVLNCGSVLMSMPSNSNLVVYKPNEKAYSELAKIRVSDKPIYATPIVSGNKIYIKDTDSLILYSID